MAAWKHRRGVVIMKPSLGELNYGLEINGVSDDGTD
jgi:hypothetical protein